MPLAVVLRHKLSKRVLTRIAIKQGFLLFWFDELLMRVLTVDLDKQLAEFAELGERDCRAVDKASGAPVAADHAAK